MTQKPPRLAEWLLERLHRSPDSRYIAGDLAEGFAKRAEGNRRHGAVTSPRCRTTCSRRFVV
jgi:hypothetical protein